MSRIRSRLLLQRIKGFTCFMSGVTLREDKMEMVVTRNKVLVTFEASFDIHILSFPCLSSAPTCLVPLKSCSPSFLSPALCDLPQTFPSSPCFYQSAHVVKTPLNSTK